MCGAKQISFDMFVGMSLTYTYRPSVAGTAPRAVRYGSESCQNLQCQRSGSKSGPGGPGLVAKTGPTGPLFFPVHFSRDSAFLRVERRGSSIGGGAIYRASGFTDWRGVARPVEEGSRGRGVTRGG